METLQYTGVVLTTIKSIQRAQNETQSWTRGGVTS